MPVSFDDLIPQKQGLQNLSFDDLIPVTIRPEEATKMPEGLLTQEELYQKQIAENPSRPAIGEGFWEFQGRQFGDSFVPRLIKGWGERVNKAGSALAGEDNQRFNPLTNALTIVGQGMAAVGDIPTEATRSLYRDVAPDAVKHGVEGAVQYVAGSRPVQKAQELAKEYPETAQNVANFANIAVNAPLMKPAGTVLSAAGQKLDDIGKMRSVTKQLDDEFLRKKASQIYENPRASTLPQESRQIWLDSVKQYASTDEAKAIMGGTKVDDILGNMQKQIDATLTFKGAENIDTRLTSEITQAVKSGDNQLAEQLGNIQIGLRDAMKANPADNAEITKARGFWAAQAKLRDQKAIEERAKFQQHASTGIQTQARTVIKTPTKSRGYTPKELALMKSAATKSPLVGLLDTAGSRLGAIGAGTVGFATAGFPGAIAAGTADYFLGGLARKGAEALQAGKLGKVANAIKQRPVVQQAVRGAMESGELAPKFTALRALGVTMNKAGQLMRGGKPFDLRAAMQLSPQVAKPVMQEMKLLEYKPQPTEIQVGAQGAKVLTPAEQQAINATRANKESLGGKIDRFTPEQRKLLDGIQRSTDGKVKIAPVAPAAALVVKQAASNMGIDTQGRTTQQLLKAIEAKQKELDDIPFDMPEGKFKSFLKDESGSVGGGDILRNGSIDKEAFKAKHDQMFNAWLNEPDNIKKRIWNTRHKYTNEARYDKRPLSELYQKLEDAGVSPSQYRPNSREAVFNKLKERGYQGYANLRYDTWKKNNHSEQITPSELRKYMTEVMIDNNILEKPARWPAFKLEIAEDILKKAGAKSDGGSMYSDYYKMPNGKRVRISDHVALYNRSISDIYIDYTRDSIDEIVEKLQEAINGSNFNLSFGGTGAAIPLGAAGAGGYYLNQDQ